MKALSTLLLVAASLFSQAQTQIIKGHITDQQSKASIAGATVMVMDLESIQGTTANAEGFFKLTDIPLGRHTLRVSLMGFTEQILQNIVVTAGKETIIDIELTEKVNMLQEVSVRGIGQKTNIERGFVPVSFKTFDADESRRYAGSRNDVARMAAGFAGVVLTNDSRNDIVIRGNSPVGLLWKLEGVDVPNPNHFGALGVTGGPVSMLNNNVLAKSSFLTGAFPSIYGNATAGVFDLQMRKGNSDKREYMAQMGFNGLEAGAEGYFSKSSQASYLVNYRYSFLGLLQKLGINFGTGSSIPRYQDLTFKVYMPTAKLGTFSVFGLMGNSGIGFKPAEEGSFYNQSSENLNYNTNMSVFGISNTLFYGAKTYGKITLATTCAGVQSASDSISKLPDGNIKIKPTYRDDSYEQRSSLSYILNTKFNAQHTLTAGVVFNMFSLRYIDSSYYYSQKRFRTNHDFSGNTSLVQSYLNWQWRPSNAITVNSGLYYQQFMLNNHSSLEPRLGLRWNINPIQSLSIGVGRHSQIQSLQVYFNQQQNSSRLETNRNLDFTFSDQIVLGYQRSLSKKASLKIETYYQSLSQVPVDTKSSAFSILNSGSDFGVVDRTDLVNKGTGKNYGIDLTLERTFDKFYYLVTTSVFKSLYKGSDGIERSTFYDGGYVVNVLAGREFRINKKSILAFDTKITSAGGKRFTPINLVASKQAGETVRDATRTFEGQLKDYFRCDFKITYRVNGKKAMQEWFFDMNNMFNNYNVFSQTYNAKADALSTTYQLGFFPNFNYRITF